jgi:transcriptional regulator
MDENSPVAPTSAVAGIVAGALEAKNGAPEVAKPVETTADPRMDRYLQKEKQLRRMQQELAAERDSFKSKETDYTTNYIQKQKLLEDPLSVLNEAGISYDKLTEMLLSQPNANDPATKAILSKLQALEAKQASIEKAAQEAQSKQYQDAVKQINSEIKMLVDGSTDFETIKELGLHEAVTELIEQTFQTDGTLMDIREAAEQVENHLLEEAVRMSQLKKVQGRLAPKAPEVPEQNVAQKTQQATSQLRTLTNNIPTKPAGRSTEKERMARAMAAFKGELK